MAYYAAVVSLRQTMHRLLNSSQFSFLTPDRIAIKFAYEDVNSLLQDVENLEGDSLFLKNSTNEKVKAMMGQIRDVSYKIEDSLESHVSDLFLSKPESLPVNLSPDLEEVKQGIVYLKETMTKLKKTMQNFRSPLPEDDDDDDISSRVHFVGENSKMVGISDLFEKINHDLTRYVPTYNPSCVSITGMAGIGKTRLATEIYKDLLDFSHFECCAWATIGPERRLKKVLMHDKLHKEGEWKYVEDLNTCLKGRKYLIVLDDIWNEQDVDKLKSSLPQEHFTGSMILLTTRLRQVAIHADEYKRSDQNPYALDEYEDEWTSYYSGQMRFLNEEESWDLLRQKVFGEEGSCPFQLEKVGKKIAKKCEGLPLTIVTVANILSKSEQTEEYWNKVATEQYSSVFMDAYEQMTKVLFPSYKYLSQSLKPFFLYMGLFPPRSEIRASRITRLWVAEGFVDSWFSSEEDICMGHLRMLVSSNVMLHEVGSNVRRIKTCSLNSAFWYICTKEARKEKFFHTLRTYPNSFIGDVESRRFAIFNNVLFGMKEVHKLMRTITSVHSLMCTGPEHQYPVPLFTSLKLVRVLDALTIHFYHLPVQVLKLIHLRYLALTFNRNVPASISGLLNLQYLIVRRLMSINKFPKDLSYLPIEIWDMQELKHLQIMGSNLPNPCDDALLPNLLSLSGVSVNSCTKEILEKVPELKKLGIQIELVPFAIEPMHCFDHIYVLERLESINCVIVNPDPSRHQIVAPPASLTTFPSTLKKLSLSGFGYPWESIRVLSQMPNLRVLKLRCYAFRGPEWVIHEGEFERLHYLLLEDNDLVHWNAHYSCFPCIRDIIIKHCYKLKEFPIPQHVACDISIVDCPLVEGYIRENQRDLKFISLSVKCSWYED